MKYSINQKIKSAVIFNTKNTTLYQMISHFNFQRVAYPVGCSLKIKMAEHLIQCSIFSVKHDGAFDFSITQVFFLNKPVTENIEIATSGNTGLNFVYCL